MNGKTLKVLEYNKIIDLLMDKAESELGKDKVKTLNPITDKAQVEILQKETEEALSLLIKKGNPPLYGIYSISYELKRVDIGGVLSPGSLLKISDSLRVSRSLKSYIKEKRVNMDLNHPIIEGLIERLNVYKHIEDKINNAIVNENEISDNASSKLKSIRRQISSKNNAIKDKLNNIISSNAYKKFLQDSIVTVREGRYVVPVKAENRSNMPGIVHDMSASGATVFVEPMAIVQLNNQLKSLQLEEQEEIELILKDLSNMVAVESDNIKNNEIILQELDFIFAKGKLALDMKATKPILNDEGYINFRKGRHPILDVDTVVPVDVYIGDEFTSLIITGPNTGGKTVTLKTVGLFALMTQSGLHIPVDYNSHMAVFEQIFADIGDEQSIEQSLSTFSSHMTNIVDILNNVKENSLVLFDELGAGTDPTEGAALAMAILDHLIKLGVRTIATTHYSQLKVYALTTDNVQNASVEFDVETLSPTYKLLIGVPGKSNAFEISSRLGLQDYIINDAKNLISRENVEFENVLQAIDKDRREIEENKIEAEKLRLEIEKLRRDLTYEKDKTKETRDRILRQSREEARDILRLAKEESDLIISELRGISSEVGRERNKRIQEAQDMIKEQLRETEETLTKNILNVKSKKPPKNLRVGESVEVISLNQVGDVLSGPDEDGDVTIQIGIMKVNAHISTLRRVESDAEDKSMFKAKTIMSSKSRNIKNEIDLRGMNIEEAILDVDKYLDDSYIAGLKEVYLIHGKGTGALREGITSYIKGHKLVKGLRIGKYGEGGDGVTVVEIK